MEQKPDTSAIVAVDALKEKYRIMVEYLKESAEYKFFCRHLQTRTLKDFLDKAIQIDFGNEPIEMDITRPSYFPTDEKFYQELSALGSIYKDMEEGEAIALFFRRNDRKKYRFFGNIHAKDYDFDFWWDQYGSKVLEQHYNDPQSLFKLNHNKIAIYADDLAEFLKQTKKGAYGRELQRKDLSNLIREHAHNWQGESPGGLIIQVNTFYPLQALKQHFGKVIREHKQYFGISEKDEKEYRNRTIPAPIRDVTIQELKNYLEVYRTANEYRKNHTGNIKLKKIVSKLPHIFAQSGAQPIQVSNSTRTKFYRYLRYAKKIVDNLETEDRAFPITK